MLCSVGLSAGLSALSDLHCAMLFLLRQVKNFTYSLRDLRGFTLAGQYFVHVPSIYKKPCALIDLFLEFFLRHAEVKKPFLYAQTERGKFGASQQKSSFPSKVVDEYKEKYYYISTTKYNVRYFVLVGFILVQSSVHVKSIAQNFVFL